MAQAMNDPLLSLADADLAEIGKALHSHRLEPPYSSAGLQRVVTEPAATRASTALQSLADQGFSPPQLATVIDLILKSRNRNRVAEDLIDLVTTGPEVPGITNRDTSVVVRELFVHAKQSVLVAGYAVYQGQKVFQALADRMEAVPELKVRMFFDIGRPPGDTSAASEIIRRYAERFRTKQWPQSQKLPEVFFDPRSLEPDPRGKACLHAKCIVVDRQKVFVSSANFTEAAHERNLEVGLLIDSSLLAERLMNHFESLVQGNLLKPAW